MLLAFGIIVLTIVVTSFYFRTFIRMVYLARKFKGPPTHPLIGNGNLFVGKPPEEFMKTFEGLALIYGDVFRVWIGPELNLFVNDLNFVEEVMRTNNLLDKAGQYEMLEPWLKEGLLVSTGRKWFQRRKIITPAFHFKILEQFIEVFDSQSSYLVKKLGRLENKDGVELNEFFGTCALDILCGRKWSSRRKVITPAFHFNNLEEYVRIFDDKTRQLAMVLEQCRTDEGFEMNGKIALCALEIICGRKWFNRRKIITPAFHFRILEQFVDIFNVQSNTLVEILSKFTPNDKVELYPYITLCALDVICETAMGVSCKAQINSDSKYVQAVKTLSMVLHKRMFDVQYRYDFIFRLTKLARTQSDALKIIHNFSNEVIVARRDELLRSQKDGTSSDPIVDQNDNSIGAKKKMAFLDILLQSNIDGKPLSNTDIQEEVDTFMFEGHDTTTSAITFCLYNLALYPEAQQKCFDEICDVIGKNKDKPLTYNDLNNLNYMELAIKETLRLFPSVPLLGRKVVKECTINGKLIPAGTNIGISPLMLGRKEEIFPQADKFIPERFDSSMVTGGDKMNPYSYIPFSAGPRNCIGQKFAVLEIKSVVSKVLRHFSVEMVEGQEEPILIAELILKSKNELKFNLKPRVYV